eukprot:2067251-Prymnesium_polylepis.2
MLLRLSSASAYCSSGSSAAFGSAGRYMLPRVRTTSLRGSLPSSAASDCHVQLRAGHASTAVPRSS